MLSRKTSDTSLFLKDKKRTLIACITRAVSARLSSSISRPNSSDVVFKLPSHLKLRNYSYNYISIFPHLKKSFLTFPLLLIRLYCHPDHPKHFCVNIFFLKKSTSFSSLINLQFFFDAACDQKSCVKMSQQKN